MTDTAGCPVGQLLGRADPIGLADLESGAALLTRVDRKYVVPVEVLVDALDDLLDRHLVLDIEGRRHFAYRSTYFDTERFDLHRAAAAGRRHRAKVRTRQYLDAGWAMLEVKTKDGRGRTVKHRVPHDPAIPHELGAAGHHLVRDATGATVDPSSLTPRLVTTYRRATLVLPGEGSRATVDLDLTCTDLDGRAVALDTAVVETKADRAPSQIDRWLWRQGIRPIRISKYCTALALLHPQLPGNRWHRALDDTAGWRHVEAMP